MRPEDDARDIDHGTGEPGDLPSGLTGKQKRFLRARGHHLTAAVSVGREGVSEAVISALDEALLTHELVKVKLGQGAPEAPREAGAALAEGTSSHVAQVLGRTVLLYRRHPERPRIVLPQAPGATRSGAPGR